MRAAPLLICFVLANGCALVTKDNCIDDFSCDFFSEHCVAGWCVSGASNQAFEGEGEGEGEGENQCVSLAAFVPQQGEGAFTIVGALTETDVNDLAGCSASGAGAFRLSFVLDGDYFIEGAGSGEEVMIAQDGGAPTFCSTFPIFLSINNPQDEGCVAPDDCLVACPFCSFSQPFDLATQVRDDTGGFSNAICAFFAG